MRNRRGPSFGPPPQPSTLRPRSRAERRDPAGAEERLGGRGAAAVRAPAQSGARAPTSSRTRTTSSKGLTRRKASPGSTSRRDARRETSSSELSSPRPSRAPTRTSAQATARKPRALPDSERQPSACAPHDRNSARRPFGCAEERAWAPDSWMDHWATRRPTPTESTVGVPGPTAPSLPAPAVSNHEWPLRKASSSSSNASSTPPAESPRSDSGELGDSADEAAPASRSLPRGSPGVGVRAPDRADRKGDARGGWRRSPPGARPPPTARWRQSGRPPKPPPDSFPQPLAATRRSLPGGPPRRESADRRPPAAGSRAPSATAPRAGHERRPRAPEATTPRRRPPRTPHAWGTQPPNRTETPAERRPRAARTPRPRFALGVRALPSERSPASRSPIAPRAGSRHRASGPIERLLREPRPQAASW